MVKNDPNGPTGRIQEEQIKFNETIWPPKAGGQTKESAIEARIHDLTVVTNNCFITFLLTSVKVKMSTYSYMLVTVTYDLGCLRDIIKLKTGCFLFADSNERKVAKM